MGVVEWVRPSSACYGVRVADADRTGQRFAFAASTTARSECTASCALCVGLNTDLWSDCSISVCVATATAAPLRCRGREARPFIQYLFWCDIIKLASRRAARAAQGRAEHGEPPAIRRRLPPAGSSGAAGERGRSASRSRAAVCGAKTTTMTRERARGGGGAAGRPARDGSGWLGMAGMGREAPGLV